MNAGEAAKQLARLKAMLPVMEAFAKGERVQYTYLTGPNAGKWFDADNPNFFAEEVKWRVRPNPKTLFVVVDKYGNIHQNASSTTPAAAKAMADNWNNLYPNGHSAPYSVIEMREVMKDEC